MRVLVTGATGLLGRAVFAAFKGRPDTEVLGVCLSRAAPPAIVACDLTSQAAVSALVASYRPDVVIHAAAIRAPDVCEKEFAESEKLNVLATWTLARETALIGGRLLYICTDYIFDGRNAPYSETAATNPLNAYGKLKLRGEYAALAGNPNSLSLRVPLLFGPGTDLNESACTAFANVVRKADTPCNVDDWQIRIPTYTPDIAATLVSISEKGRDLTGVFNYTSNDRFTRYGLCERFAALLGHLPMAHVTRISGAPPGAPRPYDCHLDDSKLRATGLAAVNTPFETAARIVLGLPPEVAPFGVC
jgi:dTDP-4-dehydrorhamnose reductase